MGGHGWRSLPLQIDAGLRFSYYTDLVEMCRHYNVSPNKLSPNAIRTWVGFRTLCHIRGWIYSLVLFWHFYLLRLNCSSVLSFASWCPDFKNWSWDSSRLLVSGFRIENSNWKNSYFFFKGSVSWFLTSRLRVTHITPQKSYPRPIWSCWAWYFLNTKLAPLHISQTTPKWICGWIVYLWSSAALLRPR